MNREKATPVLSQTEQTKTRDRRALEVEPSSDRLVDVPVSLLKALSSQHSRSATTHRYEIKMVTEHWQLNDVESWLRLHRAAFRVAYPQRQVNNIYFDTPDLNSFEENLAGVADRRKLRLRWYGNGCNAVAGILECKCKRDVTGWKIQQPLTAEKDLTRMSWSAIVKAISAEIDAELRHQLRMRWRPVLVNRYQRQYYISTSEKVRVTVDFSHVCYDQRLSTRPNISRPIPGQEAMIIEVKASVEERHALADVVSDFPLRVGKHSKYVTALESNLDG